MNDYTTVWTNLLSVHKHKIWQFSFTTEVTSTVGRVGIDSHSAWLLFGLTLVLYVTAVCQSAIGWASSQCLEQEWWPELSGPEETVQQEQEMFSMEPNSKTQPPIKRMSSFPSFCLDWSFPAIQTLHVILGKRGRETSKDKTRAPSAGSSAFLFLMLDPGDSK